MVKIYAIECIPTGFVYVGCTKYDPAKRLREHMSLLKSRKHTSFRMIEDFHEHGRQSFTMKVLKQLPANIGLEEKRQHELAWMEPYRLINRLYNENSASFGKGTKPEGWKPSPESNEKRRLAQLGKPKGQGAKISATKKALGQRPTEECWRKGQRAMRRNTK